MAFELVKRISGSRSELFEPSVSIAYHSAGGTRNQTAFITLSTALVRNLGWAKPTRVLVYRDIPAGKVLIERTEAGDERSYSASFKANACTVGFKLIGVVSERRPAHAVKWELDGKGGVIVTMPDWAAPERVNAGTDGARRAMEDARARIATVPYSVPRASLMERVPDPMAGRRVG